MTKKTEDQCTHIKPSGQRCGLRKSAGLDVCSRHTAEGLAEIERQAQDYEARGLAERRLKLAQARDPLELEVLSMRAERDALRNSLAEMAAKVRVLRDECAYLGTWRAESAKLQKRARDLLCQDVVRPHERDTAKALVDAAKELRLSATAEVDFR